MTDTPTKLETRKDTLQVVIEPGASHAGNIAGILTRAVREVGDWATDVFEMREAARRAEAKAGDSAAEPPATYPG